MRTPLFAWAGSIQPHVIDEDAHRPLVFVPATKSLKTQLHEALASPRVIAAFVLSMAVIVKVTFFAPYACRMH